MAPLGYKMGMFEDARSLPEDPAELRDAAVNLVALVKSQALQIEKLKHELAGHRRHRFGSTSETLDQLNLRLEEEEIAAAKAAKSAPPDASQGASEPRAKPKRRPLPADLPRNEQVLSPGDACGKCGGKLKTLGEDVTEELEYVPGHYVVNR